MSLPLPAPSASTEEILALEHASLCAWPALATAAAGPFLLRHANGFTRRANSAVLAFPLPSLSVVSGADCNAAPGLGSDITPGTPPGTAKTEPPQNGLQARVQQKGPHEDAATPILPDALFRDICAWYAARNLPPLFRIPQAADRGLDAALAARGCPVQEVSLVMSRPLHAFAHPQPCPPGTAFGEMPQRQTAPDWQVASLSREEWLNAARHLLTETPLAQATLERMLALHTGHCDFHAIHHGSAIVSCALGVFMEGMYGLYSIRTAESCRRQGCATALVSAMMQHARQLGAHTAWLQVLAANAPAIRLYERFGFVPRYRYWYRSA
ncbi:GNAT family N-acetyltransferase [Desulfovibrio psychrotolerans]|uniref:N-acetyltransferase domain-containing protein n=1 Tax=Desulfovibrio psychrotolerans TaxID=415242 RepID=A0A7J0BUN9_9BACT|nr:GNAT family N-acetyltransferase [Desulfovibrio psychrotolerans]GFM36724.1 hypothetical protein DSM19430T_14080 [Desulfovibrio psychrotolerans]